MKATVEYVKKSQYRSKVLKTLANDTKMPSRIAKDTGIVQNHISNTLKQLKEHDLVECINPEVRKGRLYRLTDNGEKIINKINGEDLLK